MKKIYLLLAFLLVAAVAGLFALQHYRELREQQRDQTAHFLARCVNQGLLTLFRLQANDWRARPDFYGEQEQLLEQTVAQLPGQLLEGDTFEEWREGIAICERLTRHSNVQHATIFRPLAEFAGREVSDSRKLKERKSLRWRQRTINRLKNSAAAAESYLQDLRADVETQLSGSSLSPLSRERALQQIDAEVLDYYRPGNFSRRQVDVHLQRVERYYELLADNPRGYSVRGGSLFFYDRKLQREVDELYRAILQGEGHFYGNWRQIVQRQQAPIRG
ncbi:hypothetical protein SAMN04487965_1972 [Microbulbifer donghaiensis]|uniref:Uncharacterized protein n=1 Tax=Microbulbifer donghaiensis TaxID=494016 RepID=A0A1M5AUW4_9GAMM|nr:hypothetical protein [Microbulbifer donghaiensis]SHF33722.1 hypothetical protein SAMN04487965_1972 [Microbulbifer donghaiensis]